MTVIGIFTWLGGGRDTRIIEDHERASYATTGAAVALSATIVGGVIALALSSAGPIARVTAAILGALLFGTLARTLTTRRREVTDRRGQLARIAVAVALGGLIGELAAIVLLSGTIDRVLDDKARQSIATAPAVVAATTQLDRTRTARAEQDQAIHSAEARIDSALVIARCELRPSPQCPRTRITGVPGRGPEARTANEMLDDARQQLAASQGRAEELDQRIATDQTAVRTAEAAAYVDADRGLGARWQAMNDYTGNHAGAFGLRMLTLGAGILLALLPLLLRWWRGDTAFDRHNAARAVQDDAERDADTAIAIKHAEIRAEAEILRAEQQLAAARLAIEADAAIAREHQRTRIVAAVGGIEIGITEPAQRELPAGPADDRKDNPTVTANLPAITGTRALDTPGTLSPAIPAQANVAANAGGGLELPLIGTVPFSDTAARWIRPLVPAFVANAIDTATHPLRTARQAFEEVEEVTFTMRRTRKVTVDSQDSQQSATNNVGYH